MSEKNSEKMGLFYKVLGQNISIKEISDVWQKLNIQKTKIMASGLITSWQIEGLEK